MMKFDAGIDASEQAHAQRMQFIYQRINAIEALVKCLQMERNKLHREIADTLGVSVGDIITQRGGRRVEVLTAVGDFEVLPDEPPRVVACVRCECAPETKTGFHARERVRHTEMDDTVIPL